MKSYKVMYRVKRRDMGETPFDVLCMVLDFPIDMTAGDCFSAALKKLESVMDQKGHLVAITDFTPIA